MKTYYRATALVSVKERMPKKAGKYIVHGHNGDSSFMLESELINPRNVKKGFSGFVHNGVTHWEEPIHEEVYVTKEVLREWFNSN